MGQVYKHSILHDIFISPFTGQELSSQNGPLKESRVDLILLAATVVTTSANQITLLPLGKQRSTTSALKVGQSILTLYVALK